MIDADNINAIILLDIILLLIANLLGYNKGLKDGKLIQIETANQIHRSF